MAQQGNTHGGGWYRDFQWEVAPLRHLGWPAGVFTAYLLVSMWMASRINPRATPETSSTLKSLTVVHNVILSYGSALMFLGLAVELVRRGIAEQSGDFMLCIPGGDERPHGPLYFWAYVYYLSKYYELLDTPLQLARGKVPPNFGFQVRAREEKAGQGDHEVRPHGGDRRGAGARRSPQVYHHALVLFMGWAWLEYTVSLWSIGMLANTAVHVVMYYYFLRCTLGKPPAWKRWVTYSQIVQFLFSFVCFTITAYRAFARGENCAGRWPLLLNAGFNATLLYQFMGIARRTAARTTDQKGK